MANGAERYAPSSRRSCATLDHVADRFDLRRSIRFGTRVSAAAYDAEGRISGM